METQAQNGGSTGPPPGSHDGDGEGDGGEARGTSVLALHQIQAIHISNEYIEGPVVSTASNGGTDEGSPSARNAQASSQDPSTLIRPTSETSEGSRSTGHGSRDSASSEQQLLRNARKVEERTVRVQPKRSEDKLEEQKPLTVTAGETGKHSRRCERCRRCTCKECTSPRSLPTCWLCGQCCVCSAESVVDYGTCVCCLKALFYHCSSDDEDVCADKPFSCSQSHCCVRWSVAGVLALFLPCLLCYLPARGCLALCQVCHDRVHRPGCRCRCRSTDASRYKSVDV